ncbi:MAG: lipoyl synthase [Deltaproteobacteria bacterium]|nr:lipoyl synthase [Deltaproteobacteria bacterium]
MHDIPDSTSRRRGWYPRSSPSAARSILCARIRCSDWRAEAPLDTPRSCPIEAVVIDHSERKPPWLKVLAPGGESYTRIKGTLRNLQLHTVCEEAHCPNVGECWREGTATVMILGDTCTRGCRFCAVKTGNPRGVVDPLEPEHVAAAVASLDLRYVVLTMVDRDDLPDGGASHVAETVRRLHDLRPDLLVEALVGDFRGRHGDIATVLDSRPDVFAHNVEVVRRITRLVRDVRCTYDQSLAVLEHAKAHAPDRITKSSLMVGAGETDDEVLESLADLHRVGVDIVTLGQYLRPSPKHLAVDRYVEPAKFAAYSEAAKQMGFKFVASGPLVRSSYRAAEVFVGKMIHGPEGN